MVRRQHQARPALQRLRQGRRGDPPSHVQGHGAGRHQPRRDRADPGPGPRRHPHRTSRHRDRPPRRRGRPHPRRPREAHRQAGPAEHPRGEEPRGRRSAGRPGCRRAAVQPGLVPARDAQVDADHHEGRRQGHPGAVLGPSRRRRDVPLGVLPRGPGPAAHPAGEHRLRLLRGQDDVRPDRREGLDLQGRLGRQQGRARRRPGGGPDGAAGPARPAPPGRGATTPRAAGAGAPEAPAAEATTAPAEAPTAAPTSGTEA